MTLIFAALLDALFGEPRAVWSRLPHPAVLIGRAIGWADARWNAGDNRRMKGVALTAALCLSAWITGVVIEALPMGTMLSVVLAAILLAQRSLSDHVRAVARALRLSTGDGRKSVAMIVGRDTKDMDAGAVARGAIESAAENLSDGVIAPAFWFALFGLPGLLVYKAINTADSMVGYLTPRHAEFGWASARLDDVVNWIPARLTAALTLGVMLIRQQELPSIGALQADAGKHRSPNAGWPEAAFSRALGIALSGPRSYEGRLREFPFVNPEGRRDTTPDDIDNAVRLMWQVWALGLALLTLIALFA